MNGEWRAETQLADHGSAGWGINIIIVVRQRTQPRELFFVALPRYSRRSDGIFVFTALFGLVEPGVFYAYYVECFWEVFLKKPQSQCNSNGSFRAHNEQFDGCRFKPLSLMHNNVARLIEDQFEILI